MAAQLNPHELKKLRCGICEVPSLECIPGLAIDYDPKTGIIKGFLCAKCKAMIDGFREHPELLEWAKNNMKKDKP
jgi:hypothetical protein